MTSTILSVLGHFLWQGTLIALCVWLALRRLTDSGDRYQVLVGGLLAMLAAPIVSMFLMSYSPSTLPQFSLFERAARDESTFRLILTLWGTGVLLCLARYPASLVRMLRPKAVEASAELIERVSQVAGALRFTKPIRVLVSADDLGPATFGFLKHVLILPASMVSRLSPEQMESVLAHEIAHMARNDFLVNLLQCVTESLLFFHPAVWWISGQIRQERENCCDDVAVRYSGSSLVYANALLNLAEGTQPQLLLAAEGGDLLQRVRRLRAKLPARRGSAIKVPAIVAVFTLLLAVSGAVIFSPTEPPQDVFWVYSSGVPADGQLDLRIDGAMFTKKLTGPPPTAIPLPSEGVRYFKIIRYLRTSTGSGGTQTMIFQANTAVKEAPRKAIVLGALKVAPEDL